MKDKSDKAFTLAEVLITLAIIGVVAALTIPALILNSQKQEWVSSYKKDYTDLTQAFQSIASDYNCVGNMQCTGLFVGAGDEAGSETIYNILKDKIKVAKNCGWNNLLDSGCYVNNYAFMDGAYTSTINNTLSFILANGSTVLLSDLNGDCANVTTFGNFGNLCTTIKIDTNGPKGPNMFGRDSFTMYLSNSGIILPHGYGGTWQTNNDGCSDAKLAAKTANVGLGKGCAARIIDEGWQMNY